MTWSENDFFAAFKDAGMLDEAVFVGTDGTEHRTDVGFVRPDELLLNEMVHITQYQIEYESATLPGLRDGSEIVIVGKKYSVQGKPLAQANGFYSIAGLIKK